MAGRYRFQWILDLIPKDYTPGSLSEEEPVAVEEEAEEEPRSQRWWEDEGKRLSDFPLILPKKRWGR